MKTQKLLLLLMALCATAFMAGGCASAPNYSGDLVYYDSGYIWWWREGWGWRYAGFHGQGEGLGARLHRPPPPGSLPPHRPGHPRPSYYFLGKNGTVLASIDGKSFRPIGDMVGAKYVPKLSDLNLSHVARYEGGFSGNRVAGTVGSSFHLDSRPVGGVRELVSNAIAAMSDAAITRGDSSASGATSGDSRGSEWTGGGSFRNEGGGGWSGGGGFSHSSGGGFGGGGGHGGGGGDRGGGNRH